MNQALKLPPSGDQDEQSVYVGFSTTNGVLARVIRWFTKSKVSHSFIIYFSPIFNQVMVMEASWSGFRVVPYKHFVTNNRIVEVITPVICIEPGLKVAADWLGAGYDYPSIIGQVVILVARWFKRRVNNPFKNEKALICSEAVTKMLQAVNYPGADLLVPENINPEDLLEFLRVAGR